MSFSATGSEDWKFIQQKYSNVKCWKLAPTGGESNFGKIPIVTAPSSACLFFYCGSTNYEDEKCDQDGVGFFAKAGSISQIRHSGFYSVHETQDERSETEFVGVFKSDARFLLACHLKDDKLVDSSAAIARCIDEGNWDTENVRPGQTGYAWWKWVHTQKCDNMKQENASRGHKYREQLITCLEAENIAGWIGCDQDGRVEVCIPVSQKYADSTSPKGLSPLMQFYVSCNDGNQDKLNLFGES